MTTDVFSLRHKNGVSLKDSITKLKHKAETDAPKYKKPFFVN